MCEEKRKMGQNKRGGGEVHCSDEEIGGVEDRQMKDTDDNQSISAKGTEREYESIN